MNVPLRKPWIATERLVQLYQSGLSLKEVGLKVGMSTASVRPRLAAAGVQIRPPRRYPKRDPGVKRRAVDAYLANDGASAVEVAQQFGVTDRSLYRWLREAGHRFTRAPGQGMSQEYRLKAIKAYLAADGASVRAIARRFNMDSRSLGHWIRQAGYRTRKNPRREHPWQFKPRRSATPSRSTIRESVSP